MSLITNLKPNAILDKSITKQKLSDDINLIFDNTEKHLTDIQHELTVTSNPILEEFTFEPHNQDSGVAQINSIHGNSVVWNQLVKNGDFKDNPASDALPNEWVNGMYYITLRSTISYPTNGGIKFVCDKDTSTSNVSMELSNFDGMIAGHKYIWKCDYSLQVASGESYPDKSVAIGGSTGDTSRYYLANTNGEKRHFEVIETRSVDVDSFKIQFVRGVDGGEELWINNIEVTDLTLMFGDGNEPTTVEEFESLYGNMPSDYNKGEIIDNKVSYIKSVGTNIWDEEWEIGGLQLGSGNEFNADRIRSKNYCKCIPNAKYYVKTPSEILIFVYDIDKQYINYIYCGSSKAFDTPTNAHYFRICLYSAYGTTYNHDICINLSDESINGKYFPYEDFVRELPAIDGGLKGAGSVYDEIRYNLSTDKWEYIQRVGSVDLGTLAWSLGGSVTEGFPRFYHTGLRSVIAAVPATEIGNILCDKYVSLSANNTYLLKTGVSIDKNGDIFLYDPAYTDTTTFKEAMNGVILYYELAEPIVTELLDDYNLSYQISKCGTVEAISDGLSGPFKGKIEYSTTIANKINSNIRQIEYLDNKIDEISDNGNQIRVTYDELVSLRDNSKLKPGCWYRITNFTSTAKGDGLSTMGSPYDVVVLSLDKNTLADEAKALPRENISINNSNLEAWKIWYSLDNDKNKFGWADEINGKGVIYRMIDEKGNDCPYDFKSIFYLNPTDATFFAADLLQLDWSLNDNCYNNVIKEYVDEQGVRQLNKIIFKNCSGKIANNYFDKNCHDITIDGGESFGNYFGEGCYNITMGKNCKNIHFKIDCSDITLGDDCYSITFGNSCYSNTFGDDCYNNSFGNDCYSNTFGDECFNNSFGNTCQNNSFGNNCDDNSFGDDCYRNSFGNDFYYNSFSNACYRNSFGDNCSGNLFGNGFNSNSFGDNCNSNSFGNNCYRNSFGDECYNNTFGDSCNNNSFRMGSSSDSEVRSFCINNIIENGVSFVNLYNTSTASNVYQLKNITVCQGMSGKSGYNNNIEIPTLNASYQIKVAKNTAGDIKVYCEADLIGDDE